MSARLALSLVFLVACNGSDDPDRSDRAGTPSGETGAPPTDSGTLPPGEGEISASCAVTDNALRVLCTVEVDPPRAVQVRFERADGAGRARVHTSDQPLAEHQVPLYLLAPGTGYTFVAEAVGDDPISVSGTFTTGDPPANLADGVLEVTGTSSVPYVGTNHACGGQGAVAVIYDTATGELAWYGLLDPDGGLGFLDMVRFTDDHTVLGETGSKIVEMDLTGEVRLELVYGEHYEAALHHDLYKRDGHVYALFQGFGQDPILDGFLVFDPAGEQVAEWWAGDALEIPATASGDWMHTNTIFVDPAGDVYLSSYTQSTVLKVIGDWTRPDFGALEWALAGKAPAGFGQDFVVDWSQVGTDGFSSQHDVSVLDDGRMVMLDNQHGRGLVLTLDEASGTARAEGEYATFGPCGPQGTAAVTSTGNVLVGCSEASPLREYTAAGEKVWEAWLMCGGAPAMGSARVYPLEGW